MRQTKNLFNWNIILRDLDSFVIPTSDLNLNLFDTDIYELQPSVLEEQIMTINTMLKKVIIGDREI